MKLTKLERLTVQALRRQLASVDYNPKTDKTGIVVQVATLSPQESARGAKNLAMMVRTGGNYVSEERTGAIAWALSNALANSLRAVADGLRRAHPPSMGESFGPEGSELDTEAAQATAESAIARAEGRVQ